MKRELDGFGIARGLEFLLCDDLPVLAGDGLEGAGGKYDIGEGVNAAGVNTRGHLVGAHGSAAVRVHKLTRLVGHAEGFAVKEQFNLVAMRRRHVHGLLSVRWIIPMPDDVNIGLFVLHHARDKEQRLG